MAMINFLKICGKSSVLQSSIKKSAFLLNPDQRIVKSCYNYSLKSARVSFRFEFLILVATIELFSLSSQNSGNW